MQDKVMFNSDRWTEHKVSGLFHLTLLHLPASYIFNTTFNLHILVLTSLVPSLDYMSKSTLPLLLSHDRLDSIRDGLFYCFSYQFAKKVSLPFHNNVYVAFARFNLFSQIVWVLPHLQ